MLVQMIALRAYNAGEMMVKAMKMKQAAGAEKDLMLLHCHTLTLTVVMDYQWVLLKRAIAGY